MKEEENCPINYIHFDFSPNKSSITKITTENERKDLPIINTLLISDKKDATIFDINLIDIYKSVENIYTPFDREDKYKLIPFDFPMINKTKFFTDNKLIKGELKSLENTSPLYLFNLIYPGNDVNYPLNMLEINLIIIIYFLKYLFLL